MSTATDPAASPPAKPPANTPASSGGTDGAPESGKRRRGFVGWLLNGNSVVVTICAFILAMLIGGLLMAATDAQTQHAASYFFQYPWDTFTNAFWAAVEGYTAMFQGAIYNPNIADNGTLAGYLGPISETLTNATPLILGGLSVGLAFRAGLFNIGGQGQVILGAICAGYVGFAWHLPVVVHLLVALLAGIVGGAVWGGIVGWLKARTGAHEVITTIMLNYVAFFLLAYLLSVPGFQAPPYGQAISNTVDANATLPPFFGTASGLRVHAGLVVAVLATIFCSWLLNRSTLGFRLRAVGANQFAARTAGMSVERSFVTVMVIAGALAGLAGCCQILGTNSAITGDIDAGIGFDAITVALLGRAKPWPTVLAAILFGALHAGGTQMQSSTGTPVELAQIIQSLIVLFIAAPALIRTVFRIKEARGGANALLAKGWNG